jgi:hypothetical protein
VFGKIGKKSRVPLTDFVRLPRLLESLARELSNRIQHAVPHGLLASLGDHERARDQSLEPVRDASSCNLLVAADLLGGLERPATGENGKLFNTRCCGTSSNS